MNPSLYLHGSTVSLNVDDITRLHLLLLEAFVNRRIQLQLFRSLRRLQADYNVRYRFAIPCPTQQNQLQNEEFIQ